MNRLPITAAQFLERCKHYFGIGEHPDGSNKNAITAWFGLVGPWCMMSMSKVAHDLGVLALMFVHALSYTVDLYELGKRLGLLVDRLGKYQPGDFILYNFGDWHWGDRPLGIHHVGVAIADLGGGYFADYEGNTDNDFKRRVRHKSNVAAVVRFPWKKPPAPKPGNATPFPYNGTYALNVRRVAVRATPGGKVIGYLYRGHWGHYGARKDGFTHCEWHAGKPEAVVGWIDSDDITVTAN